MRLTEARILWRRLDQPGHEYAELRREASTWRLEGVALFEHEKQPCRIDYRVECDETWTTRSAAVAGWVGERRVDLKINRYLGSWKLNDAMCPQVEGCTDVDLNFSPSTNLLPIRRLNLRISEVAHVRAAWLRFPSFVLEPLEQSYQRISERLFRYESAGGKFVAELVVDAAGFAIRYGNIWKEEKEST